jgi:hypothetical protein
VPKRGCSQPIKQRPQQRLDPRPDPRRQRPKRSITGHAKSRLQQNIRRKVSIEHPHPPQKHKLPITATAPHRSLKLKNILTHIVSQVVTLRHKLQPQNDESHLRPHPPPAHNPRPHRPHLQRRVGQRPHSPLRSGRFRQPVLHHLHKKERQTTLQP